MLLRFLQDLWRGDLPILDEEELKRLEALRRIHEKDPRPSAQSWAEKLLEEDAAKVNA